MTLEYLRDDRVLVWHDEFDGTTIDTDKWSNVYGNYRNYNWNSKDITRNVSVEDGIMSYLAAKDYPNDVSDYSGAYIHTNNKFEFRYGLLEARIRFPNVTPHHTTFWTLGACNETISVSETSLYDETLGVRPPSCGEIDIAEFDNKSVGFRTHWSTKGFDSPSGYTTGGNVSSLSSSPTDWHIYSIEWTEQEIVVYVDDVEKGRWATNNASVSGWNPFRIPHYIIFDCISALNGSIAWDVAKTDVDWVRVYAPAGVTEIIKETSLSIPAVISIDKAERYYLEAEFTPQNPSDMTILWESENPNIATCYGGMVIGNKRGVTHIKATSKNGCVSYCKVIVDNGTDESGCGYMMTRFQRYAGLSTDEKPTPQGNAVFLELDTAKVYYYKNGAWSILG